MSSNAGAKMKSIEEEMSRFEEEIMSLTQDPTPIGGTAPNQESNQKGSSLQFQPRQAQGHGGREGGERERGGGGGGVPRAPGFQPRQMGRPGGNMPPRSNRPGGGQQGFVPHQLRVNQRPQGPPRFPHLPPPPPPPPMNSGGPMGPMPGMVPPGPPPPNMMGPLPPPPMPPFAMMPPGPPPMNAQKPVTLSAKPTTYASKPVLNKKTKKKVKKEKSTESKDQSTSEEKEVKSADEPAAPPAVPPGPPSMPHPTPQQLNMPPMNLPPPPAIPQAFVPNPAAAADLSQLTQGGEYELGTASEPLKKKDKKKKHIRVAAGTTWEDDSLAEWDPNDFRLFAGDLGNEVTEDTLAKVFGTYPSYLKCKIIRDKRTNKTKGYGFISFKDPRDFVQAMKDWNGKYVGNRPIKLLKSTWKDRDISSVKKKQKEKDRLGLR